jgi:hypothetical protein
MRISPIGRIGQWAIGAACIASLAACGTAAQEPSAPTAVAAPSAIGATQAPPVAAEPTAEAAPTAGVVPTADSAPPPTGLPPTLTLEETIMPDQPSPPPPGAARPTLQVAATLAPAGAAPDQPPPVPPNSAAVAPPLSPELTAMADTSRADLAKRLALPVEQVELVEVRTVIWPDKGLGCPQPGMGYLQVQVDGLLIRLRAAGQIYHYHTDGIKTPFLCEQKLRVAPAQPPPGNP